MRKHPVNSGKRTTKTERSCEEFHSVFDCTINIMYQLIIFDVHCTQHMQKIPIELQTFSMCSGNQCPCGYLKHWYWLCSILQNSMIWKAYEAWMAYICVYSILEITFLTTSQRIDYFWSQVSYPKRPFHALTVSSLKFWSQVLNSFHQKENILKPGKYVVGTTWTVHWNQ